MKRQSLQKVLLGGIFAAFLVVVATCNGGGGAATHGPAVLSGACAGFEQILGITPQMNQALTVMGLSFLLATFLCLGLRKNLFAQISQFFGVLRRGVWRHLSNVFFGTEFRQLQIFRVFALATVDPQVYNFKASLPDPRYRGSGYL